MFIPMGEKNKTVRVYDLENEIISSQTTVTEMYAEAVSDGKIYLLAKVGATRAAQTLREKTNIDKLECFLKKRHYDVAYKFAKNEKFSEEVLADICRYHGDFHYSKVQYWIIDKTGRECIRRRWRTTRTPSATSIPAM